MADAITDTVRTATQRADVPAQPGLPGPQLPRSNPAARYGCRPVRALCRLRLNSCSRSHIRLLSSAITFRSGCGVRAHTRRQPSMRWFTAPIVQRDDSANCTDGIILVLGFRHGLRTSAGLSLQSAWTEWTLR
eukprot:2223050-Prymnesium_polylepis.1